MCVCVALDISDKLESRLGSAQEGLLSLLQLLHSGPYPVNLSAQHEELSSHQPDLELQLSHFKPRTKTFAPVLLLYDIKALG